MLPLLLTAAALASPPTVLGAADARSVVLIVADSATEERAVRCDDLDGDGAWTCPAGALPPRLEAVGLLIDGRTLIQSQGVALGEAPAAVVLERVGTALRVSTDPPAPRAAGPDSRPGAAVLVAELRGEEGGSPKLMINASDQRLELTCSDDGAFPDRLRNDGVHTCLGLVPDGPLRLSSRSPQGGSRALGELSWPPELGLRQVRIEGAAATVASWPVLDRAASAPPRREDAPRAQGPPQGSPQAPGAGAPLADGPSGLQTALAALGGLILAGVVWRIASGRPTTIPNAVPLAPPPVVAGGPTGSALYRAPAGQRDRLARWLMQRLSQSAPVLWVGAPLDESAPRGPGPVWLARSTDVEDVAAAARALARRGVPPAVVCAAGLLTCPGAVGPAPEAALLRLLPHGAILALALEDGAAPVALPEVRMTPHESEWRAS